MKVLNVICLCLFAMAIFFSSPIAHAQNELLPDLKYPQWPEGWNPGTVDAPSTNCVVIQCECTCTTEGGTATTNEVVCAPYSCSVWDGYTCGPLVFDHHSYFGTASNCH